MQKASGRIECGGRPALARQLHEALRAPSKEDGVQRELTHGVHSYPARMHPAMTRRLLRALDPGSVLDPFCGSGTTLVEARFAGIQSAGVELNELAVRVARAKTWVTSAKRREAVLQLGTEILEAAREAGKLAKRNSSTGRRGDKKRDAQLSGWFAPHVRRELEWLDSRIDEVEDADFQSALKVALSSILYKVSNRTSNTDETHVKRQIPRGAAARHFRGKLAELLNGLAALSTVRGGGHPEVTAGDARHLRQLGIGEGGFDCVLTSPPYAGTYDYAAHQELRLAFFGLDTDFSKKEIGSRRYFHRKRGEAAQRVLHAWRKQFGQALGESIRAVRSGGSLAFVIGDSLAGDLPVYADDAMADLVGERLSLDAWAWQERPTLGQAERKAFRQRPKREHILVFRKG